MTTKRYILGATALALTIGAPALALADGSSGVSGALNKSFQPIRDRLSDLSEKGIDLSFGYLIEPAYNFNGGTDSKFDAAGELHGGATFDLEKLMGLNGSSLTIWLTQRHGSSISGTADIGNFEQLQQIAGRGEVPRITRLFWSQDLLDDRANFKIGYFPQSDDFDSFGCDFVGLAFCGHQVGDFIGDTVFQYPISNPAFVARINLTDNVYVNGGVFAIQPDRLGTKFFEDHFDDFGFVGESNGAYIPVQLGWSWEIGEQKLPGDYQIGGWFETADTPDIALDENGSAFLLSGADPKINNNDGGMWVWGKQQVTRRDGDPDRGLYVEGNMLFLDNNRTFADRAISTKVTYQGLFDSRPNDIIGIAYSQINVSGPLQTSERQFNAANPGNQIPERKNFEHQIDLLYRYQVVPEVYFLFEPAMIINPGGFDDTVWAMQGRFAIDF